jgi:Flp pilus assembly protein TadG
MRNFQIRRMTKSVSRTGLPLIKRSQSCRGQALVEFTLVAMFFFLLAFAAMDFSWLLFNQMNMQDAVREAARYASTGNSNGALDPVTGAPSRAASIIKVLNNSKVGTQISSIVISNSVPGAVCNTGSVPPTGMPAGCAGGPGAIVTIQVNCNVPLLTYALGGIFTGNQFGFTVQASFKNEPFPAAAT